MKTLTITISFLLVAILGTSGNSMAQQKGIQFSEKNWAGILAEAKQTGKLIFMDAYTTWCGPCKWMKANVFSDAKVGDLYNRNFINAYVDMEHGEGIELSKKYQVHFYPTALYINGDGEVVHKVVGQCSSTEFIQDALDAMSPERNLQYLQAHYKERSKDLDFVSTYLKALKQAYEPDECNKLALEYLQGESPVFWQGPSQWLLIHDYVTDASSPVFTYLVSHRQQFVDLYGKKVEEKIYGTYLAWPGSYVSYPANGKAQLDEQGFNHFLSQLASGNYEKKKEIEAKAKLTVYSRLHKWDLYASTVSGMLDKKLIPMNSEGAGWLYSYAENISRFGKDKARAVTAATGWARIISEDIPGLQARVRANYLDLYATLLEGNGKTALAKQVREKIDQQQLTEAKKAAPFQQLMTPPKKN